jgi:hypothetical protein
VGVVTTSPTLIPVVQDDLDALRGRLFELIESFGLADRQERACKKVIRRCTYDLQGRLIATLREGS